MIGQYLFFFKDFIYLFMRNTEWEREAETQAEGEAGSMQGAWSGTRYWVSRIRPWAEGCAKPLSHQGCPGFHFIMQCWLWVFHKMWLLPSNRRQSLLPRLLRCFEDKSMLDFFQAVLGIKRKNRVHPILESVNTGAHWWSGCVEASLHPRDDSL